MARRASRILLLLIGLTLIEQMGGMRWSYSANQEAPPAGSAIQVPPARALTPAPSECQQIVDLLKSQKRDISRELRQIKREIAVLKQSISEPGMREIFGGIGYILGLLGVAYYVHARKLYRRS